jgi:hypothetical protein
LALRASGPFALAWQAWHPSSRTWTVGLDQVELELLLEGLHQLGKRTVAFGQGAMQARELFDLSRQPCAVNDHLTDEIHHLMEAGRLDAQGMSIVVRHLDRQRGLDHGGLQGLHVSRFGIRRLVEQPDRRAPIMAPRCGGIPGQLGQVVAQLVHRAQQECEQRFRTRRARVGQAFQKGFDFVNALGHRGEANGIAGAFDRVKPTLGGIDLLLWILPLLPTQDRLLDDPDLIARVVDEEPGHFRIQRRDFRHRTGGSEIRRLCKARVQSLAQWFFCKRQMQRPRHYPRTTNTIFKCFTGAEIGILERLDTARFCRLGRLGDRVEVESGCRALNSMEKTASLFPVGLVGQVCRQPSKALGQLRKITGDLLTEHLQQIGIGTGFEFFDRLGFRSLGSRRHRRYDLRGL